MTQEHAELWRRAVEALRVAQAVLSMSPGNAASRAYYAAFHAVSALLAAEGRTFTKHSGVRMTVHRDLVRSGRWAPELGEAYDDLLRLREMGDYGGTRHASAHGAGAAVEAARTILGAVSAERPDEFPMENGP